MMQGMPYKNGLAMYQSSTYRWIGRQRQYSYLYFWVDKKGWAEWRVGDDYNSADADIASVNQHSKRKCPEAVPAFEWQHLQSYSWRVGGLHVGCSLVGRAGCRSWATGGSAFQ